MPSRSKAGALAICGRTPSPESVRELAGSKANIHYFQSPKNHRRFVFCNQLVFFIAILLEADTNVTSYYPAESDDSTQGLKPSLTAVLRNGQRIGFIACYGTDGRREAVVGQLAELNSPLEDAQPKIVTAQFIRDQHIQIENWLLMCAMMNRAKNYSCIEESEALLRSLRQFGTVSIGTLVRGNEIDEARTLAALARGMQAGTLVCETSTEPLTYASAVALRRGGVQELRASTLMKPPKMVGGCDLPPLPYESTRSAMARLGWRHGIYVDNLVRLCNTHDCDPPGRIPDNVPAESLQLYCMIRDWLKKMTAEGEFRRMHIGGPSSFLWQACEFRFCPLCLEACYHSFLFQWRRLEICPLHGCPLATRCLHCGRTSNESYSYASIGLIGYRCVYCKEPISGGEPSLALHQQFQVDAAYVDAVMAEHAHHCEVLFSRLTFLCSPDTVFSAQAKGSLRQWTSIDHIFQAAQRAVARGPLPKGVTNELGMTFLKWWVRDSEHRWPGLERAISDRRLRSRVSSLCLVYAATRRRLARWVFSGRPAEREDRRLCALLEISGDSRCVGDWNQLELTYLIFRISMEKGDLRPVQNGGPPIVRTTLLDPQLRGQYGQISLITYRAWLLGAFAIIHAYLRIRGHMTIDEAMMVPNFPQTLVPTHTDRNPISSGVDGIVYFPHIDGMPLWPFRKVGK
jgi:hypothetical protein